MIRGITFGSFDLFHAGHVLMLQEARTVCDHLTVFIQSNPNIDRPEKNVPVQNILETTGYAVNQMVSDFTGKELCKDKCYFNKRKHSFSSTELRQRCKDS